MSAEKSLDLLRADLIAYIFRQSLRYEDDVTELNNRTVYRDADPVDHLEMIMAQTRMATADKIFADIQRILHWSYNRERSSSTAGEDGNYTK